MLLTLLFFYKIVFRTFYPVLIIVANSHTIGLVMPVLRKFYLFIRLSKQVNMS